MVADARPSGPEVKHHAPPVLSLMNEDATNFGAVQLEAQLKL